ncbi:hypothetical protein F4818DRAFT_406102 [Hypoxylon cercidicola]|nr:hypothetical protein F4818DRAFT_406102 [Hypoxylon cercidicola]
MKQDIYVHVTQSYLRLVSFYRNLPPFLKISPSSSQPSVPHIYLLHLQYHTAMILLHRPFFQMIRQGVPDTDGKAGTEAMHVGACRSSAEWVSNILRIYKATYTMRHIPISAVHYATTVATIHLADTTSSDAEVQKKAIQRLQTCVLSLREMRTAWASSTRCILSIQ